MKRFAASIACILLVAAASGQDPTPMTPAPPAAPRPAEWAEPMLVARHMHAQYMACFMAWGIGDIDLTTFRVAALSGICHLLIGITRGPFAAEVEARLRTLSRETHLPNFEETRHAPKSRTRRHR